MVKLSITFRRDDSLVQGRVSVAFKDLPIEQGIKRILVGFNYSLLFDKEGRVSQVMIVSEEPAAAAAKEQLTRAPARPASAPSVTTQKTVPLQPSLAQQALSVTR